MYRGILTVDDTLKELKKLRKETCDVFVPHFSSYGLRTLSGRKRSKHCTRLADHSKAFNINEIVECQHPAVPAGCPLQVTIGSDCWPPEICGYLTICATSQVFPCYLFHELEVLAVFLVISLS